MSTRSSSNELNSPLSNPERLIRQRNRCDPSHLFNFEELNMANNNQNINQEPPPVGPIHQNAGHELRPMEELLQAPIEGVGDAIVVPAILANQFEIKIGLLNLITSISFHGFENDDPHSHIKRFTKITQTLKINQVPHNVIKLILFPFSLEGAARTWIEKEPPGSITTWEDLVSKFVNRFFPPSKTTNLRNAITNFHQNFGETFSEAWDRFKELLAKCPHHGFSPLHQIDTFYNGLNQSDQDSLNSAAGGNLLMRNTQEALTIIENKAKVRTSRNTPQASSAIGSSSQNDALAALTKQIEAMGKQIHNMQKPSHPVHAVNQNCETCGGPHPYYECQAAGGYTQEDVYATSGTFNQGNRNLLSYRSNNYLGPPGFNQPNNQNQNQLNQNNQNNQNKNTQNQYQNRQNQGYNQNNRGPNFNQGNNYNQNQGFYQNQGPGFNQNQFQPQNANQAPIQSSTDKLLRQLILKQETQTRNQEALNRNHEATMKLMQEQMGQMAKLLSHGN